MTLAGVQDNEIASHSERKIWKDKWKLPQHLYQLSDPKDSPAPPAWSNTYVSTKQSALHITFYRLTLLNSIDQ